MILYGPYFLPTQFRYVIINVWYLESHLHLEDLCLPWKFNGLLKIKVRVTLRLAVYRQSVSLGAKPLDTQDQRFFFNLNPRGHGPYVVSSVRRR
jgi:hypothetical protein